MAKPVVDLNLCTHCGLCAQICPEVFEMREDGSHVKSGVDYSKHKAKIDEAIAQCPGQAISWE